MPFSSTLHQYFGFTSFRVGQKEAVQCLLNQSQKERIAPYRPSINSKLAKLFAATIPNEAEKTAAALVDWSFLDEDDGQPGKSADGVRKQIEQLEKWGDDDLHKEILEDMQPRHQWTRNILPPNIPKRYDPNEPPF